MSITRKSLADAIDTLDDQIAELQSEKAETFAAYRAQLEHGGAGKSQVKVELAALKAAIRQRRKLTDDREHTEQLDALSDEILCEIATGTVRATRTRTRASVQQEALGETAE
jgi:hypothetical protein